MYCWEVLGRIIHEDHTLTSTTCQNIVVDHIHPSIAKVLFNGSAFFHQYNAPYHSTRLIREWFVKHKDEFLVLSKFPRHQSIRASVVSVEQVRFAAVPPLKLLKLNDMLVTCCYEILQNTFRVLNTSIPRRVRDVLAAHGGGTTY